jgi:hypothetical protein
MDVLPLSQWLARAVQSRPNAGNFGDAFYRENGLKIILYSVRRYRHTAISGFFPIAIAGPFRYLTGLLLHRFTGNLL